MNFTRRPRCFYSLGFVQMRPCCLYLPQALTQHVCCVCCVCRIITFKSYISLAFVAYIYFEIEFRTTNQQTLRDTAPKECRERTPLDYIILPRFFFSKWQKKTKTNRQPAQQWRAGEVCRLSLSSNSFRFVSRLFRKSDEDRGLCGGVGTKAVVVDQTRMRQINCESDTFWGLGDAWMPPTETIVNRIFLIIADSCFGLHCGLFRAIKTAPIFDRYFFKWNTTEFALIMGQCDWKPANG